MCGLAGLWRGGQWPADLKGAARAMADSLAHRGPDAHDVWTEGDVAFGHRRLSVIDLSPMGKQPMTSRSGRYVITLNGEIYNYQELRAALGGEWRGTSDTEVLLAGFDAWGVAETLKRCVGMYAFAVWDREERRLLLARDRLGEKPMYYGWWNSAFVFASELKAMRALPGFAPPVSPAAVAAYFQSGFVPGPMSIHEGISKLEPGCLLELRDGQVAIERYWSPSAALQTRFQGDETEAVDELERLLGRAVRLQMVADVPVGAFLSGGIDSSAIGVLMQEASSAPIRTYSIGFAEKGYDETPYAAEVARRIGSAHTELVMSPDDALSGIDELTRIWDEPFADSSQLPTALVARLARKDVTVALSGDGGDELFCGYERHLIARRIERLPAKAALAALLRMAGGGPLASVARIAPVAGRRLSPRQLRLLAEVLGGATPTDRYNALVLQPGLSAGLLSGEAARAIRSQAADGLRAADLLTHASATDLVSYLPDDILVKVDRAAMATSLETRAPLLDHRVVEFALSLPGGMKVRHGQSKWPLRQLLYRRIPRELFERPKHGFDTPVGRWMKGPLRGWAEALVQDAARSPYLNADFVRRIWAEHQAGTDDWGRLLWRVVIFQLWQSAQAGATGETARSRAG